MDDKMLADELERALNVLGPLCSTDYLFTAPNAAPGCELRISTLRQIIASLRALAARDAVLEEAIDRLCQEYGGDDVAGNRDEWNAAVGYCIGALIALQSSRQPEGKAAYFEGYQDALKDRAPEGMVLVRKQLLRDIQSNAAIGEPDWSTIEDELLRLAAAHSSTKQPIQGETE